MTKPMMLLNYWKFFQNISIEIEMILQLLFYNVIIAIKHSVQFYAESTSINILIEIFNRLWKCPHNLFEKYPRLLIRIFHVKAKFPEADGFFQFSFVLELKRLYGMLRNGCQNIKLPFERVLSG